MHLLSFFINSNYSNLLQGVAPTLIGTSNKMRIEYTTDGSLHNEARFQAVYTSGDERGTVARVNHIISGGSIG